VEKPRKLSRKLPIHTYWYRLESTSNGLRYRSRGVFILVQEAIAVMAKGRPEAGVKLYLESALTADRLASKNPGQATGLEAFGSIAYEFISQSFSLYEENVGDSNLQSRCIVAILGTLLACRSLNKADYESLIMKAAQYSAKMLRKPDQCVMVAQCSHLFFVVSDNGDVVYSNPQRSLECLQRALKLADACTTSNPANAYLFVDLLEHYMFFFEKKHPSISGNYVTGLIALIKEHTQSLGQSGGASKAHFLQILAYIKAKKEKEDFKEMFAAIDVGSI
jgi:vacuolar protein sorting-associated protein 35